MPNTINADNGVISGITGIRTTADNTGNLALQTNGNTVLTLNTANAAVFAGSVTANSVVSTSTINVPNTFGFKNRIINGGMMIDQRNAGSAITPTSTQYMTDRFSYVASAASKFTAQQNAGSVTPPAGFINYLGMTSTSAYSIAAGDYFLIRQYIEGLNIADLAWGTENAKTVTLSFWVRSSLTGTFGGSLQNSAQNRGYPFSYTISSANTWTQISVTIPGDTTGTWLTTNSTGIQVNFSLGTGTTYSGTAGSWAATTVVSTTGATSVVGTNGATFYLTGVQLEVGSQATSFDFRDYGRELIMCQRYYESNYNSGTVPGSTLENTGSTYLPAIDISAIVGAISFRVWKRTAPTITIYNYSGTAGKTSPYQSTASAGAGTVAAARIGNNGFGWIIDSGLGLTTGQYYWIGYTAAAEL